MKAGCQKVCMAGKQTAEEVAASGSCWRPGKVTLAVQVTVIHCSGDGVRDGPGGGVGVAIGVGSGERVGGRRGGDDGGDGDGGERGHGPGDGACSFIPTSCEARLWPVAT